MPVARPERCTASNAADAQPLGRYISFEIIGPDVSLGWRIGTALPNAYRGLTGAAPMSRSITLPNVCSDNDSHHSSD